MENTQGIGKSTAVVLIISYCLTLFWMGVIFYLSAQVATVSNELSTGITEKIVAVIEQVVPQADIDAGGLNHFVRKNAHFAAYLLLGVFTANSLYLTWLAANKMQAQPAADQLPAWMRRMAPKLRSWSSRRVWLSAWTFCVFYAVTDELHQYFVPGRGCQIQDVLIDSAGAAVGILIYLLCSRMIVNRRRRKTS